jgi:tetratricopeptide (TPR) repeat protein
MQLDEAGDAFARALERDGKFYQALLAEAQMFSASRQVAPALAKIDAARKLITEAGDAPEGVAEVEVARARLLASQQQIKAALTALDQALEAYSSHNDAQVLRGTLRLQRGDTEGGKADLMEVFERTGGYPGLASPLGRLLAQDNELEQLEALVGKRAEHPGASVDVKLIAARLRLAKGELDPAKRLIDQALAKEPNHWEGHMLMARAFLDGGDWGEALERVVLARPTAPRAELHLLRGKIFEYNGKYDEARPEYQQAVTLEPNLHEARFLYGRSLGFGGANKQAVEQIQHAIDHAEDRFPEAYLELGRAQKQLGDTAAALASLERAVTLDSALSEAYYLQGRIRYENNEIGAAVTALEEAVAESSQSPSWYPDAYIFLGRAQEKAGNTVKARAAYKKFLGVASPEHPSRAQVEADLQRLR